MLDYNEPSWLANWNSAVSKRIPTYLRLHTEDTAAPPDADDDLSTELRRLAEALSATTGWNVRRRPASLRDAHASLMELEKTTEGQIPTGISPESADQLLRATNSILAQLHGALNALRQREAELAAGIPVAQRLDEQLHLAERLEAILRGGAEAVQCQAAALYLLDDATTHLKMRACWGLPRTRLIEEPRPLRGSVADLEALVGHAVVIENTRLLPHWKTPEPLPAAVCLPVSTPSTPLGTLWIFSDRPRDFSETETQLLEIVAGRIATELEREVLLMQGVAASEVTTQLARIGVREQERLPSFPPILEHWEFAGWASPPDDVGVDFYDWGVLRDGRPFLAVGGAEGTRVDAALTSTVLHTALKSHTAHAHDARQLLENVNETIWATSAGDQFASLFYSTVDPESPQIEFAFAGRVQAMIVGPRGIRTLTRLSALLGLSPDTPFPLQRDCVRDDEVLVVVGGNILRLRDREGNLLREEQLAAHIYGLSGATAEEILECLRTTVMTRRMHDPLANCTLLVARRKA